MTLIEKLLYMENSSQVLIARCLQFWVSGSYTLLKVSVAHTMKQTILRQLHSGPWRWWGCCEQICDQLSPWTPEVKGTTCLPVGSERYAFRLCDVLRRSWVPERDWCLFLAANCG
jgi:hypothetical protein